ncbi:MAG TPA: Asp-tRNA(Asn)/Glu-tRNA(Gln) amidotransferase subunit GatB [Gemmatimonadaceae bacterium]|nr:Asp-tRNA(Asn)/Glu-tRNA(Gln) amidotransferase subunit GatB [Gemmatimonadaceae bacterium]
MTATAVSTDWEMVVGLEVHVQLRTRTKAFCNCSTEFGAPPNVNTCPVCLALPGALPVLNVHAVELATRAALALDCEVNLVSVFARKNYFYPDLPKGYQISQFDKPLAEHGHLTIGHRADGALIRVGIERVHMEEDAGKSLHDRYPGVTAIDLNRAGVPLIEIVSGPDMRSAEAAGGYLRALKQILQYCGISDCDMEKGSLRVDANVSARRMGEVKLGTKTEVKNLNSFSNVEKALAVEFARQVRLLESGGSVQQQTMLFDAARGEVRPSRTKEGSHDYRYFPEPDLPPLVLAQDFVDRMRKSIPELPEKRRQRFVADYALGSYDVEVLTSSAELADYFEGVARQSGDPKAAANWTINGVLAALNASGDTLEDFRVRPADLASLITLVRDGVVAHSAARQVFAEMVRTGDRAEQVAKREGLVRVDDDGALAGWIDEVFAEHPVEAQRYVAGERKLQGVLVGLVMKKSKGSADAKKVNQLLAARARG